MSLQKESPDWLLFCSRFQTRTSRCPLQGCDAQCVLVVFNGIWPPCDSPPFILKTGKLRSQHRIILAIPFAKRSLNFDIAGLTTHPTTCCKPSHTALSTLAKAIRKLNLAHGPGRALSLLAENQLSLCAYTRRK